MSIFPMRFSFMVKVRDVVAIAKKAKDGLKKLFAKDGSNIHDQLANQSFPSAPPPIEIEWKDQ